MSKDRVTNWIDMIRNAVHRAADNFIEANTPDTAMLVHLTYEASRIADIGSISAVSVNNSKVAALMASAKHTEVNNRPAIW